MATQKKAQNLDTKNVGLVVGIAAGVAAITAAGYFLFGPQGKNNRKVIKGWTVKMKGEVLEKIEKLKHITPEVYDSIIDDVATKYSKLKHIAPEELEMVKANLKRYWKIIARDIKAKEGGAKKKVATTKAVVKKAVKKVAKTVAKEATKVAETV